MAQKPMEHPRVPENAIIAVEGLWKNYAFPLPAPLARLARRHRPPDQWPLQNISFSVARGETFGVIGPNGAGKSTLLKILAGVSPPTRGRVRVAGRVFPMIELNAGMHRELTGRENIRLLGAFMGLSPRAMNARMDEIAAFSELRDWLDEPVRKYSSGMLARLGFSVAMNVDADILLIDEVLAVGDTAFRRKCYDKMEQLRAGGITLLFVSHTMRQIERLCGNALVLDRGRIAFQGTANDAVHYYMDQLDAAQLAALRAQERRNAPYTGTGEAVFTAVELLDAQDLPTDTLPAGAPIRLRLRYHAQRRIPQPIIGVGIIAPEMVQLALQTNENDPQRPDLEGDGEIRCAFPALRLTPGGYTVKAGILGTDGRAIYKANSLCPFRIAARNGRSRFESGGLVETEVRWEYAPPAPQKA